MTTAHTHTPFPVHTRTKSCSPEETIANREVPTELRVDASVKTALRSMTVALTCMREMLAMRAQKYGSKAKIASELRTLEAKAYSALQTLHFAYSDKEDSVRLMLVTVKGLMPTLQTYGRLIRRHKQDKPGEFDHLQAVVERCWDNLRIGVIITGRHCISTTTQQKLSTPTDEQ